MPLAIEAPHGDTSSLAYVGSSLIRALDEAGHAPIAVPSSAIDLATTPPAVHRALHRHRILRRGRRMIVDRSLRYGLGFRGDAIRAHHRSALFYWDSDLMPATFAPSLAAFDALYGVSSFVADVLQQATGRPVGVIHHGIWPDASPYTPPPTTGPFSFLHLGQVDARKATDLLLRAFVAAFPPGADVRLVIKCRPNQAATARAWHLDFARADPRIEIVAAHQHRAALSATFAAAHAVVLPSRCEGFGLVGLEALAHGRMLIAHGFSGPCDYLDPDDCAIIPSASIIPAPLYPGHAREPDFEALVAALRAAAASPDESARRGLRGRARVLPAWNWRHLVGAWASPRAVSAAGSADEAPGGPALPDGTRRDGSAAGHWGGWLTSATTAGLWQSVAGYA